MTDVFDTKIMCKKCDREMHSCLIHKNGLELRAVKCFGCGDVIIHPADLNGMEHFKDLKDRKFNVKLRMVGNSHTISIPKEIINFMSERHKEMKREMDEMVSLWFDDFDTLKVGFMNEDEENEEFRKEGDVRRDVRDYGYGNIDIVEEKTLNKNGRQIKKISVKKIRRNYG